jgi:hypothetical protein
VKKITGQPDVVELDFINIGPECFAAGDKSVISWRGENYVPQAETTDVDTALGFDVNDFESSVVYAIFNDPEDPDIRDLPEALKPQFLDVPLYEDDSPGRVVKHARLMNEDRDRMIPPRGHVRLRRQTILKTPWTDVPLDDALPAVGMLNKRDGDV